jgi:hypothetical protein
MQRYAIIYLSISAAVEAALGEPIGHLSGRFLREMAEQSPSETADFCTYLADCAEAALQLPETVH